MTTPPDREVLMLTCSNCGREFEAGIQITRASFASARMSGNKEGCPHCQHVAPYEKADYHFGRPTPPVV